MVPSGGRPALLLPRPACTTRSPEPTIDIHILPHLFILSLFFLTGMLFG
jgi:hypothetical protein